MGQRSAGRRAAADRALRGNRVHDRRRRGPVRARRMPGRPARQSDAHGFASRLVEGIHWANTYLLGQHISEAELIEMNGAESLILTALNCGVEICFANPGTTEMPLVAALDGPNRMRAVLALFEGVVTGAADGYARMADRPALTLTHLGPGFANGIANLHNARRAHSPIVNVIGDHATWHLKFDAPLTSDIESLARPVSAWVRHSTSANAVATDMAEAIAQAMRPPGHTSTLIVPSDCQWSEAGGAAPPRPAGAAPAAPQSSVRAPAEILRRAGAHSGLFMGGLGPPGRGV